MTALTFPGRGKRLTGASLTKSRTQAVGRRSSYFVALFVAVGFLCLLGLIMVLSASAANALRFQGSSWYYFRQQLMWLGFGTIAMFVTIRVDYRFWRRLSRPLLAVTVFLLVILLTTRFGISRNGATRWVGLGPVQIQPAELAKLALILHCGDILARRREWRARYQICPVLMALAAISGLLLLQPNLGTTIICASIVLAMLFASGAPLGAFAGVFALGVSFAGLLAVVEPYRLRRLIAFGDVWANRSDASYQTVQSLISVSNGGITGVGIGASRGKWGYLPFPQTDFIFSIIAEELGLLGSMTVICMFLLIGVLGFATASHAPDDYGHYLAIGITTWLLVQAFMNISVTVGLIPVTGVPLPFLSAGGSSLVVTMGAVGMLMNVARQAR